MARRSLNGRRMMRQCFRLSSPHPRHQHHPPHRCNTVHLRMTSTRPTTLRVNWLRSTHTSLNAVPNVCDIATFWRGTILCSQRMRMPKTIGIPLGFLSANATKRRVRPRVRALRRHPPHLRSLLLTRRCPRHRRRRCSHRGAHLAVQRYSLRL